MLDFQRSCSLNADLQPTAAISQNHSWAHIELQNKWPFFNEQIIIYQKKFSIISTFSQNHP